MMVAVHLATSRQAVVLLSILPVLNVIFTKYATPELQLAYIGHSYAECIGLRLWRLCGLSEQRGTQVVAVCIERQVPM
ncbi:hypothetical protein PM082_023833 [Marasmius tenuissimus]|nr:hypothetical protein PM082_023833 [Marasmius tenuissimus]